MTTAAQEKRPSDPKLEQTLHTLVLLEKHGCPLYQLVECPQIVLMDAKELQSHLDKLRKFKVQKVSMPLIMILADSETCETTLIKQCHAYLRSCKRHSCFSNFVADTLQCTTEEMLLLVDTFPYIFTNTSTIFSFIKKIELVVNCGKDIYDFKLFFDAVASHTIGQFKDAVAKLNNTDHGTAVSFRALFPYIDTKNMSEMCLRAACMLLLQIPKKEIDCIIGFVPEGHNVTMLADTVEVLLNSGFTRQEIANRPDMFEHSVSRITAAYNELQQCGVDDIDIDTLSQQCSPPRKMKSRVLLTKPLRKLGLSPTGEYMGELPKQAKEVFFHQLSIVVQNFKLLRYYGFKNQAIEQCMLCLVHPPECLERHLASLPSYVGDACGKSLTKQDIMEMDAKYVLNVLEYYIEKESMFSLFPIHDYT